MGTGGSKGVEVVEGVKMNKQVAQNELAKRDLEAADAAAAAAAAASAAAAAELKKSDATLGFLGTGRRKASIAMAKKMPAKLLRKYVSGGGKRKKIKSKKRTKRNKQKTKRRKNHTKKNHAKKNRTRKRR